MKPKKSVYCKGANRPKIKFECQSAAENFIKFNSSEILMQSGKTPIRAYYCRWCVGWHTSSSNYAGVYENDKMFDSLTTIEKVGKPIVESPKVIEIRKEISEFTIEQKREYFERRISEMKMSLETKEQRIELDVLYSERAKAGLKPDKAIKDPFEGYEQWFKATKS